MTDPHKDLINPAVQGTLNMLRSAHKANTIKRIAITSSYAAVLYPTPEAPGYVFTEKDWNEYSPKQVELLGVKVDGSRVSLALPFARMMLMSGLQRRTVLLRRSLRRRRGSLSRRTRPRSTLRP